ncbi:MAG TPA: cation transporter [Saprospirales bacterium]|nr:cation transporter [Saprospirales bacterium]HAY70587.1 cation transporter [Saprospirales bacterium]HRQ30646.1 cation diffusion facilitator family transporter [Saprospiraceae bacterium]
MSATHSHHHDLHHHHHEKLSTINTAFMVGIILNLIFVIIEFGAGWFSQSMALMSDAGHNLTDVFSLLLAMLAFRMSKVKSNQLMTYGLGKTTILASLVNALILFVVIGGIAWESVHRLLHPRSVDGTTTIIVAGIGIIINAFTAWLFFRNKDHDLNIKGAYLHLMADALVSFGVVVAGIVILATNWYLIDTIMSFVIIGVIFFSTWSLFKDSLVLTIDGVPKDVDTKVVTKKILEVPGVQNLHHLHIWALSTTVNALTAHVVVEENTSLGSIDRIKTNVKHMLHHYGIDHVTLEFESDTDVCKDICSMGNC